LTADKITCRDTTWLLSDSRERALTDEELTALKQHIEECKLCQGASAQFEVLFRQINRYFGAAGYRPDRA